MKKIITIGYFYVISLVKKREREKGYVLNIVD